MLYETVKEQDNFVSITHACVLTDILVAIGYIVARYAAYRKSYILVEALPSSCYMEIWHSRSTWSRDKI